MHENPDLQSLDFFVAVGNYILWTKLAPWKFLCWNPNPQCNFFENMAFREVVKLKCNH